MVKVINAKSRIDEYRLRANCRDISGLSGRTSAARTNFITQQIHNKLQIKSSHAVVDVGCGDGTFIDQMIEQTQQCVGVVPTEQEAERLSCKYRTTPEVRILVGLSHETGLTAGCAHRVICNGVILLLGSDDVLLTLKEFSRIGKSKALVFIGEVPFLNRQS